MSIFGAGHEVVTSTTRPASPTAGQIIFETDTASVRWYTGSAWVGMIPVGTIQSFAGTTAPVGWLLCYGQSLNATSTPIYNDLWSVVGTTYGGSSITAFNVPDLRGRAPHGKDDMGGTAASRITSGVSGITGTTLGAVGGNQLIQDHTHTYSGTTNNDSPDHSHGPASGGNSFFVNVNSGGDVLNGAGSNYRFNFGTAFNATSGASSRHQHTYSGTTANHNQSSGGSSQNMPPTIITNYIIKY
jgi:microcystin-dependent protein